MITISPAEALSKGLPGLAIEVDQGPHGFVAKKFPDAQTYLRLSGPPGGPLSFTITSLSEKIRDGESLLRYLKQQLGLTSVTIDKTELLKGGPHITAFYTEGAAHCLVLFVPVDESTATTAVNFLSGLNGMKSCHDVISARPFESIRRSLHISLR